jgi:molybdopterin synthase sulfurtransferase
MSGTIRTVSAAQIVESLSRPARPILDIRPVDAYNGWKLRGEPRGGHIPSARSLPGPWAHYIDWPDILEAKDIRPEQSPILYGYDETEAMALAERFLRAGFREVGVFPSFVEEWSAQPRMPLSSLPRHRHLVPAVWLRELMQNGSAPEHDGGRLVIAHAHYRNRAAYEEGHIPGAIALDTNWLESPEGWNRREPNELRAALQNAGITFDTTVVLYGRTSVAATDDPFPGSSAGQLGAMRCAHIMLYAGVRDVRILNGGLQAWVDAGYETTTEESAAVPVADFGADIPQSPELFVDLPRAKQILQSPGENLVCVRSWAEFTGQVSGYNYIEKKGRIPGAVFADCGRDAYHMENYRNVDETAREYHEIVATWKRAGVTPEKLNAFYCGTGWRASEAFFNAWLLGWPRIAVFDGGWFEWSQDESNPWETGLPAETSP